MTTEKTTILEPKQYEYSLDNKEDKEKYDDMLNECTGEIKIGCLTFDASRIVEELDPTAYQCGFNDHVDGEPERWKCPICEDVFEDQDEAKWHCQEQPEDEENEE
jgi:hypothetical protein